MNAGSLGCGSEAPKFQDGVLRPRVGVIVDHPIQYFSPLFDALARNQTVQLAVGYGNDFGMREALDRDFGSTHRWDIDLVAGHPHEFFTTGHRSLVETVGALRRVVRFTTSQDAVIIHGYSDPISLTAIAASIASRTPYLLRSDSSSLTMRKWFDPRYWIPRLAESHCAGALYIGRRNAVIHKSLGARHLYFAPFSVDNSRFSVGAQERAAVRNSYGISRDAYVVSYCGKFYDTKGIEDLVAVHKDLPEDVWLLLVGDGQTRAKLEALCVRERTVFTGFVNQSSMPKVLGICDVFVLPSYREAWGLAVNEAMASGSFPIVSDAVGCSPDLVEGVGSVYPAGDRSALHHALAAALATCRDAETRAKIRGRVSRFDVSETARAYEGAVDDVLRRRRRIAWRHPQKRLFRRSAKKGQR